MRAYPDHRSALGAALRSHRKRQNLTQIGLADRVGLCPLAIRRFERGRGRLGTFWKLLAALGLELRGRTLDPGPIGPAMATARRRRKQSRATIARGVGCSRGALAAIERGVGLLSTLESYGHSVGAGLHLASVGAPRTFFDVAISSARQDWETPVWIANLLTEVVGGFDLDRCAATHDHRLARVKATLLLTAADNGLIVPWHGLTFVNPPFGDAIEHWACKCATEAEASGATVIVLFPVRTSSGWWHRYVKYRAGVFLLKGRLAYGNGDHQAPFASAVVAWNASAELIEKLAAALPDAQPIPATKESLHLETTEKLSQDRDSSQAPR